MEERDIITVADSVPDSTYYLILSSRSRIGESAGVSKE